MTDSKAIRPSLIEAMLKAQDRAIADTGGLKRHPEAIDCSTASEAEKAEYLAAQRAWIAQQRICRAYVRLAVDEWMEGATPTAGACPLIWNIMTRDTGLVGRARDAAIEDAFRRIKDAFRRSASQ
jgi:hypothetical protein